MKSDREFIEGIYAKAEQQKHTNQDKSRKDRGMLFYARRYVPAAVCLLLLFVLVPRYFVKNPNQELEPDAAPFQIEQDISKPQGRNDLTRNLPPEGDVFSIEGAEENSPFTIEQTVDPIVTAEIKEIREKDGIRYIFAGKKDCLQGTTGDYLLIEYHYLNSSEEVEFLKGELDILYLASIIDVNDENAHGKKEEYIAVYEELFSDSEEYIPGLVPDVYVLIDGVNGKFTYKEDRDGIPVFESVNGIQITEDELRNNGR